RAYFRETLAPAHKLFKTTLFTQGLADKLGPRVALSFPGDVMRSTGVPPITQILGDLHDLKQTVATFPTLVGNTLHEELEKRQFDAGQLTREVVETLVKD